MLPTNAQRAIFADPSSSFWIKRAIADLNTRDALDAARDAELLARVMRARADNLLNRGGR